MRVRPVKKSAPAPAAASRSRAARRPAASTVAETTGLSGFSISTNEPLGSELVPAAAPPGPVTARPATRGARSPVAGLAPEAAALAYLDQALVNEKLASFVRPSAGAVPSEFKSLGTEALPLSGTTVVKFRQTFNKIPVYGSLVTVELDKRNACVGINSSLGTPEGVNHIAKVSPAQAAEATAKAASVSAAAITQTPRLYYYFEQRARRWRLAYILENVVTKPPKSAGRSDSPVKDFVVDAHTGKLLAELPRTATMADVVEQVRDANGKKRRITLEVRPDGKRQMRDATLNVTTFGFGFRDPSAQYPQLPGTLYASPPGWPMEAIGAHANGSEVARFMRKVLLRNNIDNRGGEMVSSVNCWDRSEGTRPARQWRNAYWNGSQMVYGQILFPDGSFYSVASMLDIVAHEMFHGVTDHTARLEYRVQAGALNESYSDIFGVIVANHGRPLGRWNWELGVGFDGPGAALRNLADPTLHGQPAHMRDYRTSTPPYTFERNDYGWVHDNSGIHNCVAHRIMTARSGSKFLFTRREIAALFYIALTVHLSRTSQFADSRRAVLQAAQSLFRADGASERARKIAAIEQGFASVGIA